MEAMRATVALTVVIAAAAAAPAAAQLPLTLQRDNELWAEQQMARQREIAIQNQLSTLEARVRTDEALRDLDRNALRTPRQPDLRAVDPGKLAGIPDDRLAASNARVRAAAANRR